MLRKYPVAERFLKYICLAKSNPCGMSAGFGLNRPPLPDIVSPIFISIVSVVDTRTFPKFSVRMYIFVFSPPVSISVTRPVISMSWISWRSIGTVFICVYIPAYPKPNIKHAMIAKNGRRRSAIIAAIPIINIIASVVIFGSLNNEK